jgi:hypothetical protein
MTPKTDEPIAGANHLTPEQKRYQRAIVERNELRAKVDELGAANSRYEYVRKLHPSDFAYVFWLNAYGDGSFDDLVDAAIKEDAK